MKRIDIICPVFREEEAISSFHERLMDVLNCHGGDHRFRVRYVLDPSGDRTEAILKAIAEADERIELLVMSRRFGHQAALVAGIDCSEAEAVIMLDSDLQHPPELIPDLIRRWADGADIVQTLRQDPGEIHMLKRTTSRWFYRLFQKLGGVGLQVGAADYRLLSRRVVEIFRNEVREHNPFLRGLVGWVGFRVDYVPFVPAVRTQGQSKYRLSTLLNFALNGVCSFSKVPLRFCVGAGLILSVLSLIVGALQIAFYFTKTVDVPGWSSLFAAVIFIGGVQLFFLGVLGEYISLIFDEVKNRPRYIVSRHIGRVSGFDSAAVGDRHG
ncbi:MULTISPECIES: glycosyltransferase family 2 protein [unclassified Mesorhizobium]|uniref:glycosyltransferase family 2 protein n=1 Tax=unclassified Mesorhizobium TaxID=325217 RepID=UPI000F75BE24|nr:MULTISPECIES: glycosyltransferase family 2 protein [unclassified Mesorhizobium]AZO31536.1 glycosyltransferase [Mesorhizobium sp. M1B.F.Ca.ET.045.04.1.1]RWB22891.1 MAG: glycosyltransferase [Mesorhizobium sp.]